MSDHQSHAVRFFSEGQPGQAGGARFVRYARAVKAAGAGRDVGGVRVGLFALAGSDGRIQ